MDKAQKQFVVIGRAPCANGFGVRLHYLVAKDGAAFRIGLNYLWEQEVGSLVTATVVGEHIESLRLPNGEVATPELTAKLPLYGVDETLPERLRVNRSKVEIIIGKTRWT